jgi:hypothetical protein
MPIHPVVFRTGVAFTLALLSAPWALAQPQLAQPPRDRLPPPRTGTAIVKGKVVDGATGAALARARVMVQGPTRMSATTDAGGGFVFTNLPAGPLMLSVDKATYLPGRYPAAGRTIRSGSRPLMLLDGQVLDNVTIPVFHGGAIMGRVLDANGDPLDNAQVSALRVPASGRVGRPAPRAGSSSDDRGEFRVGRLEPGSYILQVTSRRNQMYEDSIPGGSLTAPSPQPLPTYYPSAMSIDQAQPITVNRGQTVGDIDVVLLEAFPGVITGTVTTPNGAVPPGSNAFVNVRRINNDTAGGFDGFSNGTGLRPDGTFKLTLPPGEYQLEARVNARTPSGATRPEDEQLATTKVTVASGGEDTIAMVVGPGASATGRVIFEGDTPAPPSPGKMRIPMYSETGMCRSGEATIAADWSFHVDGLAGTCASPPMGMFGRWVLKAIMVNGTDIAESPVTFQPGQQIRDIQVIVTDRRSTLSFRVADESGQATRDYVVIVYPVKKERWRNARIFVGPPLVPPLAGPAAQSTLSAPGFGGSMMPRREEMQGVPPGQYYVVAVDDLEPEDFRDPAVLERLRGSGAKVTISEGGSVDVPLRRVSFAAVMSQR